MTLINKIDGIENVTKDVNSSIKLSKCEINSNENSNDLGVKKRLSQNIVINSSETKLENHGVNENHQQFNHENPEFEQTYSKINSHNVQKEENIRENPLGGDTLNQIQNETKKKDTANPIDLNKNEVKSDENSRDTIGFINPLKPNKLAPINTVQPPKQDNKISEPESENCKDINQDESNLNQHQESEDEEPKYNENLNQMQIDEGYSSVAQDGEKRITKNNQDTSKKENLQSKPKIEPQEIHKNNEKQTQSYKKADSLDGFDVSVEESHDKVMIFDQDENPNEIVKNKRKNRENENNEDSDDDNVNVIQVTYSEEESAPPEEPSVQEQQDIEDEIEEFEEFDSDAIEEAQIPKYAFKGNKKRGSEEKFEREINRFGYMQNSNSNDGSDGFFKKSPNKSKNQKSNLRKKARKNKKLEQQEDDPIDNIEVQEYAPDVQPQKYEPQIEAIQNMHENKVEEIVKDNQEELENKKKLKKKKKAKDKADFDNLKSQFEEKERSKLDQIEQKLKQLNKMMKKDKPKPQIAQKKVNQKTLEKPLQNKTQNEMEDKEEHHNEELKSKITKYKQNKVKNSKEEDIEDLFGMKSDILTIQNPRGRFDPLNQQKTQNKIEFKAEPPSYFHNKNLTSKQPLVVNKNDSDFEIEEIDVNPSNNAFSAIKSNKKFESNIVEPTSFREEQKSQNPLSNRFGLGFGGLSKGGLSKDPGFSKDHGQSYPLSKYQRNNDPGIISPVSRIPNTILNAQLSNRDKSVPPQRTEKLFGMQSDADLNPSNPGGLIADFRLKYGQLGGGGLGSNVVPSKKSNLVEPMTSYKSKITPSPRMREDEFKEVQKNDLLKQLPFIGYNQSKQNDNFSSGSMFNAKPTNNFNFSSKLGANEPFKPREVPKKAVFEFSKFDDPKPSKFGKSKDDAEEQDNMIDEFSRKPPQKKQDVFNFHQFNKILSKEKEPDKKKHDLLDSFDFD